MIEWVLVVAMVSHGAMGSNVMFPAVQRLDFKTESECMQAKEAMVAEMKKQFRVSAVCVRRSTSR